MTFSEEYYLEPQHFWKYFHIHCKNLRNTPWCLMGPDGWMIFQSDTCRPTLTVCSKHAVPYALSTRMRALKNTLIVHAPGDTHSGLENSSGVPNAFLLQEAQILQNTSFSERRTMGSRQHINLCIPLGKHLDHAKNMNELSEQRIQLNATRRNPGN